MAGLEPAIQTSSVRELNLIWDVNPAVQQVICCADAQPWMAGSGAGHGK
jgi:hypothetical protein